MTKKQFATGNTWYVGTKKYSISDPSAAIALRYATGKYRNVSRGIIAMQKCIETLEKANKEKRTMITELEK